MIGDDLRKYFEKLESCDGIQLNDRKRAWYAKKIETQLQDMKREYPSTPAEAFEASIEGAYFAEQLAQAELQGRVGPFKAQPEIPVHTAWDLGVGDATSIWFFAETEGQNLSRWLLRELRRRTPTLRQRAGAISPASRLGLRLAHRAARRPSSRNGAQAELALRN